MKKADLKKKIVKQAVANAGSYAALARRLNRTYRSLLNYRDTGEAPADIVAAIESIANEGCEEVKKAGNDSTSTKCRSKTS